MHRYKPGWENVMRCMIKRYDCIWRRLFVIESTPKKKNETKAGRGSTAVKDVAVMAESIALENIETGKVSTQCRYFKMQVLTSHKAAEINEVVKNNMDINSIVFSDQSTSYFDIPIMWKVMWVKSHPNKQQQQHLNGFILLLATQKETYLASIIRLKVNIFKTI